MKSTEKDIKVLSLELDLIKKSLLVQKAEILNKNLEFKNMQNSSTKAADEADAVVQDLQDNLNIQLHERDRMSLLLIDKALSKFTSGTYGQCELESSEPQSGRCPFAAPDGGRGGLLLGDDRAAVPSAPTRVRSCTARA